MAPPEHNDDIELMQYADGELSDGERDAITKHLEGDDQARAKVEALGHLHEVVAGRLEADTDGIPDHKFAAMWREVGKAIEDEAPKGFFAKIGAWIDRHRGHVVTGMVSAGAVAAVALVLRTSSDDTLSSSPRSLEVLPASMRTAPVVESLDTPDGSGTVMNFEDEDGHTTVIWVTPADTVEGI